MKIFLLSLGCAKNQVDSEKIAGILKGCGHRLVESSEEADAAIVNTCGFIEPAVEESVDAILELEILKRSGKIHTLGIIGCLVNRYGVELRKEIPSADFWAKAGDLEEVARAFGCRELFPDQETLPGNGPWSRYLKISEGCNNRCSYCMIPSIRGRLASTPPSLIVKEAEKLILSGAKEICLVGQDLTSYGRDLAPGNSLGDLMQSIEDRFKGQDVWFRLLYLHPLRVDKKLIDKVAGSKLFLNYLDVPVQHADPDILKAMNREGTEGEKVLELFSYARTLDSDFALRTTLMVGFPGETEGRFRTLLGFLEKAEIDRAGAFTFYPEEGTVAAGMDGQVPGDIKEERLERLLSLQEAVSLKRQKIFEGRVLKVLVEEVHKKEGYLEGRSFREAPEVDGVIEASLRGEAVPGHFMNVRITGAFEHDLVGEVAGN